QFRGPNASGVSRDSDKLPVKFSTKENVRWKKEIGEGIACPIVVNGRVIATTFVDGEFIVLCFDAKTGEEYWRHAEDAGKLPALTLPNTQASSTPASDGDLVFAYFSTVGMIALDLKTGDKKWKAPIQLPFYLLSWGAAHSPIVFGDTVIFNQDDDLQPFLVALDKYTGDVRWRTERKEMLAGYAVPVLCKANGRTDIVVAGSGKLKGYDPESGKELWTCNTLLRTIMTTPAVQGDKIFVSVQSYGDTDRVLKYALLQWKDTNQDGKLEKSELEKAFWKKFDKGDLNKDKFLVDDEIDIAFQAPTNMVGGGNSIQAVRGGGRGDVTKTHVVWNIDNKAPSNIASPLVFDDKVFVVKKGGISASFRAEDGAEVWTKKRIRNFGNYYASPIAGDGKIYVTGENGYIVVLDKGDQAKVLAKNDVGESAIATPAIADGCIYVRTLNNLYCFSIE
ncbi:MAG: PQQ-binding-like beta-propeller repeat protein, partial [Pirellulaceae bacterium]|nr:PQQ-binding-like beta-propeller repeat protein [Pirellulaceae bacterium]